MEAPVTGSLLPREQCCHQGAARPPLHLVPLEANRYIMRLLVLSSLCPCSIKAPSLQLCNPVGVPPACLHDYCQFYFTYANFNCVRVLFICTTKVHFVYCSDVKLQQNGSSSAPSQKDSMVMTTWVLEWTGAVWGINWINAKWCVYNLQLTYCKGIMLRWIFVRISYHGGQTLSIFGTKVAVLMSLFCCYYLTVI